MRVLATTGDGTAALVDAQMPVPESGEVLVRVEAATINYADRWWSDLDQALTHMVAKEDNP